MTEGSQGATDKVQWMTEGSQGATEQALLVAKRLLAVTEGSQRA